MRIAVLIFAAACSRAGSPRPDTRASVAVDDAAAIASAVDAAPTAAVGDASREGATAPFTRVTVRVTERHSTTTATTVEMKSQVTILVETERGTGAIGPTEWPCWAGLSDGLLQCVFGASYEQARVEKKNGTCAVVADFYGENTGEKKNVRKLGSFPCHDPLQTRFEEAPGLAKAP